MNDQEARAQISQMENFILKEAEDKSQEIESKGLEEFGIEKFRIVTSQKEKIRQEYSRKAKQVETQCAIARSLAINKSRLEKIKARQAVLGQIQEDAKKVLQQELSDQAKSKAFVTSLIAQGALMLLEDQVTVQCRECDVALVQSCLQPAASQYSKVIQEQAGAKKSVTFTIDKSKCLPPPPQPGSDAKSCLGGVVLSCQGGNITIDNTVNVRLELALEQDKPAIRGLLFPLK
jgi:V-type H+-transporting ATPase subunit E